MSQYQPPTPPQPQKRPMPAWAIIGICCLLLAAYAGIATLLKSNTQPTSSDASTSSSVTSSGSTWTTTHTFSGNGIKQTEIFSVPGDWLVQWRCSGFDTVAGQLGVIIYDSQANVLDVAVNSSCKANGQSTGSTEEHQGGSIYLKIDATGDWSVDIQEMQ